MTCRICLGLLCLNSLAALAQTRTGARDLFFGGFDNPPVKKANAPAQPPLLKPVSNKPLGLRYAILKVNGAAKQEVPASTRFQAGDRIQIKLQSNSDGYLYIVSQGTSGNWNVLYPQPRTSSRIRAGIDYTLPNNSTMKFAGQPGVEKLFVVLSRTPETSLDTIINNLKNAQPNDNTEIASNTVSDPMVSRLRASTRDLVLEESIGSASAPAEPNAAAPATLEKATYIASKSRGLDARVVADIRLTHE